MSLNTGSFFCANKMGLVVSDPKKPLKKIVRKQQNFCELNWIGLCTSVCKLLAEYLLILKVKGVYLSGS